MFALLVIKEGIEFALALFFSREMTSDDTGGILL